MNAPSPIIQVDTLSRRFRMGDEWVDALNGTSFSVSAGEFFGITGPSGSGKSTLLYLLGGMDRPTSGSLHVCGRELSGLDENELAEYRRTTIGFIYQSFHLIPTMSALQNVEFPMIFARLSRRERRARACQLLEMVGLGHRLHHRPSEMSGGQRQRVAIARALTNCPPILLCDEPTGNLDSRTGAEVVRLLSSLACEQNVCVIIVSHDPSVIEATRRSLLMQDGQIREEICHV